MPTYSELVKKARELHKTLGENEFRRRYEGNPSLLAEHAGVGKEIQQRAQRGKEILEAFRFYPITPRKQQILNAILEKAGKEPLYSAKLGDTSRNLHVLEERGLIRLAKVKGWKGKKLIVTEVFDQKTKAWRKAAMLKARGSRQ